MLGSWRCVRCWEFEHTAFSTDLKQLLRSTGGGEGCNDAMQAQLLPHTLELACSGGRTCRMPNLEEGLLPQSSLQDLASILCKCIIQEEALHLHMLMCNSGIEANTLLGTYLVASLVTNGSMRHAQQVFDRLIYRTDWSWNALMSGYYKCEKPREALSLFAKMQKDDYVRPNCHTFVVLLQACAKLKDLESGIQIHLEIFKVGLLDGDLLVGSVLVHMYTKCGALAKAQQVMDNLQNRDVVSWTTLIIGYYEHECSDGALKCFEQMKCEGVFPNAFTFVPTLKVCGCKEGINKVCQIHAGIEIQGLVEIDLVLGNTLVDIYGKCGMLAFAEIVFDRLPIRDTVSWTALIAGFVEHGQNQEALDLFDHMKLEGIVPNSFTYVCCLKACGNSGATCRGQEMHMEIERTGLLEMNHLIGSCLVNLYAKCGLLLDAKEVFDKLPVQDVVSWTALIGGYAQEGRSEETLRCFEGMQLAGISPNSITFVFALKVCGSIGARDQGQQIHAEIERQGLLGDNLVLGNNLIDMYVQCSLLCKGREVFEHLLGRNIVSWNTLVAGYAEQGKDEEAVKLFEQMEDNGVSPNAVTFSCLLKSCSNLGAMNIGLLVHAEIEKQGLLKQDIHVGGGLVDMYAKCGSLESGKLMFDKLPVQDVTSWTALIAGYVEHGCSEDALNCFEQMQIGCVFPNIVTVLYGLKACGDVGSIAKGYELHAEIERQGFLETDDNIGNSLVEMYVKCRLLAFAQQVFNKLPVRDAASWAILLSGYMEHRRNEEALECFKQMQLVGLPADDHSCLCILKACSSIGVADGELHVEIERKGLLEESILVGNTLLNMYARSGQLEKAQQVFDTLKVRDVVSWNVLVAGFADHGHGKEALQCLKRMQLLGIYPDIITYVLSLKACGDMGATCEGGKLHSEIERQGLIARDLFIGSALIQMYCKLGSLVKARQVFDKFPAPNIVLWNVLLAGYAQHGHAKEAFMCFEQMQLEGVCPSTATFISCLKACSSTGASHEGRKIHAEIERKKLLEKDALVGSTLVDMYAKCGFLSIAQEVFDGLPLHDVVSWTTLIAGYSRLGKIDSMFYVFDKMLREAIKPDPVIFVVILGACKHIGRVNKSLMYFEAMSKDYGIDPTLDHNMCVIDVLGRAGQIEKAVEMIKKMQLVPNLKLWDTVLGACRYWGNVKFGRIAFEHALCLDTNDAMAYVLMSQICAGADLKNDLRI